MAVENFDGIQQQEETIDLTLETNKFESDNEEVIIREEKKFKKKKKFGKS